MSSWIHNTTFVFVSLHVYSHICIFGKINIFEHLQICFPGLLGSAFPPNPTTTWGEQKYYQSVCQQEKVWFRVAFQGCTSSQLFNKGKVQKKKGTWIFFWPLVFFMLHLLNNKKCEKSFRRDGWVDLTKIALVHLVTEKRTMSRKTINCGSKRWTTLRTRWTRATGPLSPGLGRSLFSWWRMFGPEIPALTNARSCRWRLFFTTGALYTI